MKKEITDKLDNLRDRKDGLEAMRCVREFDKSVDCLRTQIAEVKDETSCFEEFFSKFAKFREDHFKNAIDKATSMEKTFDKLISQYRAKGYKIPDLSTNKNLFEPCPLLMEDSNVYDYFKYKKREGLADQKDQLFLVKLNDLITEKLNVKQDELNHSQKIANQNRRLSLTFIKRFSVFRETLREQTTDFDAENEKLEKENHRTRALIREYIDNSTFKNKKSVENSNITNSVTNPRKSFKKSTNPEPILIKNLDKSDVGKDSAILSRLNTAMKTEYINTEKNILKSPRSEEEPFPNRSRGDSTKKKLNLEQSIKRQNSRRESMKTPRLNESNQASNMTMPSIGNNSNSSNKKNASLINTNKPLKIMKNFKNKFMQNNFPEISVYDTNQSKNRQSFLETKVDFKELESMEIKEFHKLIVEYCRILNYSEQKINDILRSSKVDSLNLWNMIQDLKQKVELNNVKNDFITKFDPADIQIKEKLQEVSKLDKEINDLKFVLLKRINIKK